MRAATILSGLCIASLAVILRLIWICPAIRSKRSAKRRKDEKCSVGIFLGSGGHTGEMKVLLSIVDFDRYSPRKYVVCFGDNLSLRAVADIESTARTNSTLQDPKPTSYSVLSLPRARRVGQPLLSTVLSTCWTVFFALWHTFLVPLLKDPTRPWVDVLLVNGPGTCVVLVLVAYIRRVLGVSHSKIIYVESFARVDGLSLSGRLLRPWVDTFVVQWPDAAGKGVASSNGDTRSRITYRGCLM